MVVKNGCKKTKQLIKMGIYAKPHKYKVQSVFVSMTESNIQDI